MSKPANAVSASPSGAEERRRHVRRRLDVEAELCLPGARGIPCRIRDFCVGGLFLAVDGDEQAEVVVGGRSLAPDDLITVEFRSDISDGQRAFSLGARVARVIPSGIGAAFLSSDPDAIWALAQLARKQGPPAVGEVESADDQGEASDILGAAESARTLLLCRQLVLDFLGARIDALFEFAAERLTSEAEEFADSANESVLRDAAVELGALAEPVRSALIGTVDKEMAKLGNPEALEVEADASDTFVQDTSSLNDWLAIKQVIDRARPVYGDAQADVERRLSRLANQSITDQDNPFGMTRLAVTFFDSVQNLDASTAARRALYHAFETSIAFELDTLYVDLVRVCDAPFDTDRGGGGSIALADLVSPNHEPSDEVEDVIDLEPTLDDPNEGDRAMQDEARPTDEPAVDEHTVDEDQGEADAGKAHLDIESTTEDEPEIEPGVESEHEQDASEAVAVAAHWVGATVSMGQAFWAAENVLRASLPDPSARIPRFQSVVDDAESEHHKPPRNHKKLLGALLMLQRELGFETGKSTSPGALKELLTRTWRGVGLEVDPSDQMVIDIMFELLDAISRDPGVDDTVQPYLRALSIPMLRAALQDDRFYRDRDHPARQLLDLIGHVVIPRAAQAASDVHSFLDVLVESVLGGYERDSSALVEVLPHVDSLIESQHKLFEYSVARILSEREDSPSAAAEDESETDATPNQWQDRFDLVGSLQRGDVLAMDSDEDQRERMILVWISENQGTFVLTDGTGQKVKSISSSDLATQLQCGTARVLDSAALSVTDRGLFRMLHGLHRRLLDESDCHPITELLNRTAFETQVEQALTTAVERDAHHVLYVLELDHVSELEGQVDEQARTDLLRQLAQVLEKQFTGKGLVAHLEDGQFGFLALDTSLEDAYQLASRQRRAMEKSSCMWRGGTLVLSVSIGLVPIYKTSENAAGIMEHAMAALGRAREAGGNCIKAIDEGSRPSKDVQMRLAKPLEISKILNAGRLRLRCQIMAPLRDEQAKPRFEFFLGIHDDDGPRSPAEFIRAAERNRQMPEVDRWVVRRAFAWMGDHPDELEAADGFSLNLASSTVCDDGMLDFVLAEFDKTKLDPSKVMFEIPEVAAVETNSAVVEFVRSLKERGCKFAVDDFGSIEGSFDYLKSIPIDYVKIDGRFVKHMAENSKDSAVVQSINEISHLFGLQTIAEFVESEEILHRLGEIGVDWAQGFGVEPPFSLEEQ